MGTSSLGIFSLILVALVGFWPEAVRAQGNSFRLQEAGYPLGVLLAQRLIEEEIPEGEAEGPETPSAWTEGSLGSLSPEDVVALSLIDEGKKRIAAEDYEGARERFERAVAASPLQPRGYYFLAYTSLLQGKYQQALAFLEKAGLLFGSSPEWQGEVYTLRGAIYEGMGEEEEARLAYEYALKFAPQNLRALSGLIRLDIAGKDLGE